MRWTTTTKVLLFLLLCSSFAQDTNRYSMTAMDLMYDLQRWYQDEKVELFEERMVKVADQERINEKIEEFFASQTFVETGASYLTSLFTENELLQMRQAVQNGALSQASLRSSNHPEAVQKLHYLFKKLDPYMFQYLKNKVE